MPNIHPSCITLNNIKKKGWKTKVIYLSKRKKNYSLDTQTLFFISFLLAKKRIRNGTLIPLTGDPVRYGSILSTERRIIQTKSNWFKNEIISNCEKVLHCCFSNVRMRENLFIDRDIEKARDFQFAYWHKTLYIDGWWILYFNVVFSIHWLEKLRRLFLIFFFVALLFSSFFSHKHITNCERAKEEKWKKQIERNSNFHEQFNWIVPVVCAPPYTYFNRISSSSSSTELWKK